MRDLIKSDAGLSLVEIVLSVALVGVVLAIASSFLVSAQNTVVREEVRNTANDEARAAMERLDREVRSSNFILTLDAHTLLVNTQSNAPTHGTSGRCVQWRVDGENLQRRAWGTDDPASVSGWMTIAQEIVNRAEGQDTFVLPNTQSNRVKSGGRTLVATFLVESGAQAPIGIRQALTGRNVDAIASAPGDPWPPAAPIDDSGCEVVP